MTRIRSVFETGNLLRERLAGKTEAKESSMKLNESQKGAFQPPYFFTSQLSDSAYSLSSPSLLTSHIQAYHDPD